MLNLFMPIFAVVSSSLMGVGVVIALVSGMDTMTQIVLAAATGFVLSLPVAYVITKKLL